MARFGKVVILMGLLSMISCSKGSSQGQKIDPREALGLVQNDFAILIDVREKDELEEGLAQPALSMPLSAIEANAPEWRDFLSKVSKDKQLVFYCGSGGRSGRVADMMAQKGYKTSNMGGFRDWKAAGLPTKKP